MKKTLGLAVLMLAIPTFASAGELYGKITSGSAAVPEGTKVSAKCGAKTYDGKTDKTGTYHLVIAEAGKCTLSIVVGGQTAELPVVSFAEGAQTDIVLETKDGKLTARRK